MPDAKYFTEFFHIPLSTFLRCLAVYGGVGRVKSLSLIFDRQFPVLFIFMFVQGQPEVKSGHFISYTLCLAQETMGIFYIIHQCHHMSFLACLHPIDPNCHKPHQQAFPLPTQGFGIPF